MNMKKNWTLWNLFFFFCKRSGLTRPRFACPTVDGCIFSNDFCALKYPMDFCSWLKLGFKINRPCAQITCSVYASKMLIILNQMSSRNISSTKRQNCNGDRMQGSMWENKSHVCKGGKKNMTEMSGEKMSCKQLRDVYTWPSNCFQLKANARCPIFSRIYVIMVTSMLSAPSFISWQWHRR